MAEDVDSEGARSARAPAVSSWWPRASVLVLMAVGAALRLYDLGKQSLWVDEGYTAYLARFTPAEYVSNVLHTVRNVLPPLYFAVLHYWTAVFGRSEASLRMPSVVAGVVAIPLLYSFVARTFGRLAGVFGAAVLTVNVFQVRQSQDARMYELLALLSVLSLYLLTRLLSERRTWWVIGLAVVNTLIVYTHHYGILFLLVEIGYVVLLLLTRNLDRPAAIRYLLSSWLLGILVLPWMVIFVNQLHKVNQHPWKAPVTWRSLYFMLIDFTGSTWCLVVLGTLVLIGTYGYRALPRRVLTRQRLSAQERQYLLLWLIFLGPVTLAFAYSALAAPVFGSKYLIASAMAFLMLAALGVPALPWRIMAAGVFAVALVAGSVPALRGYYGETKEQWREATAYVESLAAPGDLVLFNAGYGLAYGFDSYARRSDLEKLAFPLGSDEFRAQPTAKDLAGLGPLVAGHPNAWIVYAQSPDKGWTVSATLSRLSVGGASCREFVLVVACRYPLVRRDVSS